MSLVGSPCFLTRAASSGSASNAAGLMNACPTAPLTEFSMMPTGTLTRPTKVHFGDYEPSKPRLFLNQFPSKSTCVGRVNLALFLQFDSEVIRDAGKVTSRLRAALGP